MRALSVGYFGNVSNTSLHRHNALCDMVAHVDSVDCESQPINLLYKIVYKLSCYGLHLPWPDVSKANDKILALVAANKYDFIWIDKPVFIRRSTLERIKGLQPNCKVIGYMIDDFLNPNHYSVSLMRALPLYDAFVVNRKSNIPELREKGCKNPIFCYMSYDGRYHYPRDVLPGDKARLGGVVGFVGTYESERARSLKYLAKNGIDVRVWGNGWGSLKGKVPGLKIEGRGLYSEDYCKAIKCFDINLCFLRKKSRDLHTTRSTEIPACGGFMLAERTEEHLDLFEESKEVAYFSNDAELLEKCRFYAENPKLRHDAIAAALNRCRASSYDNVSTMKVLLKTIKLVSDEFI